MASLLSPLELLVCWTLRLCVALSDSFLSAAACDELASLLAASNSLAPANHTHTHKYKVMHVSYREGGWQWVAVGGGSGWW